MDRQFQDRIDEYLLRGDKMPREEKEQFLREIEQDEEKKEQLEFTRNVKAAISSREEKLRRMDDFRREYEEAQTAHSHAVRAMAMVNACPPMSCEGSAVGSTPKPSNRRTWFWLSGIAAVLAIGFFALRPLFQLQDSPKPNGIDTELQRGSCNIFNGTVPADTTGCDTVVLEKDPQPTN